MMGVREWLIKALGGEPVKGKESERSLNNEDSRAVETEKKEEYRDNKEFERMIKNESVREEVREARSVGSEYDAITKNSEKSGILSVSTEKQGNRDVLLDIYEKLAKIEEITRIIDDRVMLLDGKVATREDTKDIISILNKNNEKSDNLDDEIRKLNEKLSILEEIRENLDGKLTETTRQLTYLDKKEIEVKSELELLEAHKRILDQIKASPKSTIELANILGYTRQYVWERLQELKKAGYVTSKKEGRRTVYYLINV